MTIINDALTSDCLAKGKGWFHVSVYENEIEEYNNIRNLTETEIKKDFVWAWNERFAEEVKEYD
ncbi:TPA: hypothetical protein ACGWER_002029 [Streptococcus agalactiae]|nr:hypothetical protein [Streptococcus agalactiae]HEO2267743.1 hypothetical protein [Streptococcus agalactiae]